MAEAGCMSNRVYLTAGALLACCPSVDAWRAMRLAVLIVRTQTEIEDFQREIYETAHPN
jgi:hypothetical protein